MTGRQFRKKLVNELLEKIMIPFSGYGRDESLEILECSILGGLPESIEIRTGDGIPTDQYNPKIMEAYMRLDLGGYYISTVNSEQMRVCKI